jgi:hypothetical protein
MAALRIEIEKDPQKIVRYVMDSIERGRDIPRALVSLLDSLYDDAAAYVEEPNTLDELAKLTRDQRRQLMRQLEAAGKAKPFRLS